MKLPKTGALRSIWLSAETLKADQASLWKSKDFSHRASSAGALEEFPFRGA